MSKSRQDGNSVKAPPQLPRDVSRIFQRGQLWYWEDPIYYDKRSGYAVPDKVGGPRYNRYVLVVQNSTTASHLGIIVIPCSSKRRNGEHDVEIPINHLMVDDFTYAKCQSIMNVDPRTLTRYVCTIPDESMAIIDGEIIKMLTNVQSIIPSEDFIRCGVNMINDSIGKYSNTSIDIPKDEESEVGTDGSNETPSVDPKLIEVVALALVDGKLSATSIVNAKLGIGLNKATKYIHQLIEVGFLIPHETPNLKRPWLINTDCPDTVLETLGVQQRPVLTANNAQLSSVKNQWDEKRMKEYIKDYEHLSIPEMAIKYKLSENTAEKYYYKFRSKVLEMKSKTSDTPTGSGKIKESQQKEDFDLRKKFKSMISPENVVKGASITARTIEDYLRLRHLSTMRSNPNMNSEEFCKTIGSIVYFSFLQSMGITVHDSEVKVCPVISEIKYPELEAWEFLNGVGILGKIDDWTKHTITCKEHGLPVRFPTKFLDTLDAKLKRSSIISNQKADTICNLVKNRFI